MWLSTLTSNIQWNGCQASALYLFADNCNTNFRGMKRLYGNNVYTWLKNEFHRETEGVDCPRHMVHICLQAVVGVPPINIEVLVVKGLKYLHMYTLQVTQFKSIDICHCWYHQDFEARKCWINSLHLLTEAVSNSHTEALAESKEVKAFVTCLLPTELIALLLKLTKPLLLWQRWPGYKRNFSKSQKMKETSLFSRIKCGSKKFQKPEILDLR